MMKMSSRDEYFWNNAGVMQSCHGNTEVLGEESAPKPFVHVKSDMYINESNPRTHPMEP
jgi:hypothetical protein